MNEIITLSLMTVKANISSDVTKTLMVNSNVFFSFIDRPGKECSVSNLFMRVQGGTLPMISKVIPRCSQHRSGNSCDGVGATL